MRNRPHRAAVFAGCLALMLALAAGGLARAQQAPPPEPEQDPYRIRVERDLVFVDVLVRDRQGRPVSGLTAEDFTILDEGKPQEVAFFEHYSEDAAGEAAPRPEAHSIVLLLDRLNTAVGGRGEMEDVHFIGRAVRQIVQDLEPGQQVAIYGLRRGLVLLHGFSSDRASLLAALEWREGSSGPSAVDLSAESQALQAVLAADPGNPAVASAIAALQAMEGHVEEERLQRRSISSAAALRTLGRILRDRPGRKSLVWFGRSFPEYKRGGSIGLVQMATFELNDAQVAIYPVHSGGLAAHTAQEMHRPASRVNTGAGRDPTAQVRALSETTRFNDPIATMRNLADWTGGRAFYNRNDLTAAFYAAVKDNSAYYSLAYYPSHTQWDGSFRRIRVRTRQRGLDLRHRRGYYAISGELRRGSRLTERDVRDALTASPQSLTGIEFGARLVQVEGKEVEGKAVEGAAQGAAGEGFVARQVEFVVPVSSLLAHRGAPQVTLDFAAALLRRGQLLSSSLRTVNVPLPAQGAGSFSIQHLLPLRMEPEPGMVLRVAVRDPDTGRIGTLDIPVQ